MRELGRRQCSVEAIGEEATDVRSPTAQTWFCATSKSGLGHLRRCSNIAHGLRKIAPDAELGLVTNAGTEGLDKSDLVLFRDIVLTGRSDMAARLAGSGAGPVIVDTAIVPGIELLDRPLVLILREMPDHKVGQFRLPGGRKWDLVIVPNPADHWLPDADRLSAGRRRLSDDLPKDSQGKPATSEIPVLLVATAEAEPKRRLLCCEISSTASYWRRDAWLEGVLRSGRQ